MATYLIQNVKEEHRNSSGVNAALVTGVATDAAARAKAHALGMATLGGETRFDRAQVTQLSTSDLDLLVENGGALLVEGNVLTNGVRRRGE